jgi:hypothetical protein
MSDHYPVREQLKALGARWNGKDRVWMIPRELATEAMRIVMAAPVSAPTATGRSARKMIPRERCCKDCGRKINYGVYCGKCEYR